MRLADAFEEPRPEEWLKLAGFAVAGVVVHACLAFSGTFLPKLTLREEKPKAEEMETLIVPMPKIAEEDIVEVEPMVEEEPASGGGAGKEAEGSKGTADSADSKRFTVKGPKDNPDPHLAKQAALRDAMEFGMIGLLNSGAGGDPDAPTAPWGRDDSLGSDAKSARGNMWGDEIGDAFGAGGLGLSGIGEGGGGRGEGIGLGNIGTLGHGAGTGTGQGFGNGVGRRRSPSAPPQVRMGAVSVSGRLPLEVIQRIVRQNFGRFRLCYENGLRSNPELHGRVTVTFTIGTTGDVKGVSSGGDMPDAGVVSCVTKAFYGLSFPQPEGGEVKVTYPVSFSPSGSSTSGSTAPASGPATAAPGPAAAAPRADVAPQPAAAGPTLGGKPLAEASLADLTSALSSAGCSDASSRSRGGAHVVSAKCGGAPVTITFAPASAGSDAIAAEERSRLLKVASVRRAGGFFLAVESEDRSTAESLIGKLVRR